VRAHHPYASGIVAVPERALAAPNRACLRDAARPARPNANAARRDRGDERDQDRYRLGPPDPLLRSSPTRWSRICAPVETANTGAVLDGDLDRFLGAALAARITGADAITGNA
jgi:hypothetical protein